MVKEKGTVGLDVEMLTCGAGMSDFATARKIVAIYVPGEGGV
jgi:hypothetical protein